jgi:hypothetical protein
MILPWRHGEVRHTLDSQLVPHLGQIMALVDLHLIRDDACAELLVKGILQVPAGLGLLDKLANGISFNALGASLLIDHEPYLEVLAGIAVFIFRRALPGDDIGTERRETDFVDVLSDEGREWYASVCIDDSDSASMSVYISCGGSVVVLLGGGPCEVSATWRVSAAAKIALRSVVLVSKMQ